jgi:hypothetical protein
MIVLFPFITHDLFLPISFKMLRKKTYSNLLVTLLLERLLVFGLDVIDTSDHCYGIS